MIQKTSKNIIRLRIHRRIRHKVKGTPERPRLCVYRSLKQIYAQVIDDKQGRTLAAASSAAFTVMQLGLPARFDPTGAPCAGVITAGANSAMELPTTSMHPSAC